jgi:hypothetical protein
MMLKLLSPGPGRIASLFCCLGLLFLSGCSNPIRYNSDYQVNTDFSELKTYAWHAPNEFNEQTNNYLTNDIVDQRIRTNVDAQLISKGFIKVEPAQADFLVNYSITVQEKIDISTYNTYGGYGAGWGGGYYGAYGAPYRYYGLSYGYAPTGTETQVSEYQQGTFVFDVIDINDDTLIWRGTAEGRMSKQELTPDERDAKIATIIREVLYAFPPK